MNNYYGTYKCTICGAQGFGSHQCAQPSGGPGGFLYTHIIQPVISEERIRKICQEEIEIRIQKNTYNFKEIKEPTISVALKPKEFGE
jgi:hypothetical protein